MRTRTLTNTDFERAYNSLGYEYKRLKKALEEIEDLEDTLRSVAVAQRIAREALE
jgi:hypothetical protein